MNDPTRRKLARLSPLLRTLALLFGGLVLGWHDPVTRGSILDWVTTKIPKALEAPGDLDPRIFYLVRDVVAALSATWLVAIAVSLLGLVIGATYRMIARAQVHAGRRDPLQRIRDLVAKHPGMTSAITALPALGWATLVAWATSSGAGAGPWEALLPQVVFPSGVAFLALRSLARGGLRALLAPTVDDAAGEAFAGLDAEGFTFDAVAVTKHTVGAVAGMALFTLLPLLVMLSPRASGVLHHTHTMGAFITAFAAVALGGAFAFARKSKISIGVDGVLVGGTTKRRFVAYRDLDHARALGETIELRAHDRVVLRLQLHGRDAGRRDAIVERLNGAIARSNELRADPAAAFVEGATIAELTRAADGAASYRFAAPSREKLWEIFESPVLASDARRSAAEALVPGIDAEERARFRIAVDQVAEPATRVRLQELLEDGIDAEEPGHPARALESPAFR